MMPTVTFHSCPSSAELRAYRSFRSEGKCETRSQALVGGGVPEDKLWAILCLLHPKASPQMSCAHLCLLDACPNTAVALLLAMLAWGRTQMREKSLESVATADPYLVGPESGYPGMREALSGQELIS